MNWIKDPNNRVKASWVLLIVSILGGAYCTLFVAKDPFEKVLMAISWLAITITCLDVIATTDVRANK